VIDLPASGGTERELWHALLDLAERQPRAWTLIGGQMVLLHALEQGREPPRVTRDLDVLADLRARPAALPQIVATLAALDFEVELAVPGESGHRFTRGEVTIDLLAPDNLGARADMHTVGALTTVAIAGGTYALERSRSLAVRFDGRECMIPCPDLAGALVVKAAAAVADHGLGPERHLSDLAVLFSLVLDPYSLRSELGAGNAHRIAAADALDNDEHEAWLLLPPTRRLEAITARALIIATEL
jgi:hypothetical protein